MRQLYLKTLQGSIALTKPCNYCADDGKVYKHSDEGITCHLCNGTKQQPTDDGDAILDLMNTYGGKE